MKRGPAPGDAAAPAPAGSFPWATLAVTLATLGAAAWPAAGAALEYERTALLRGELWRLWTAHLVHHGASHLAWNLAVFVPAGVWLERLAPAQLRGLLVATPAIISGVLLALDPALARYAGMSGIATGVLVLLALTKLGAPVSDRVFWGVVLVAVAVKIVAESLWSGPLFAVFASPDVRAVPLVHLVGAAVAGLSWSAARMREARTRRHSGTR